MSSVTITIVDVGEDECVGQLIADQIILFQTQPKICQGDVLRSLGKLLAEIPIDVLYAIEHKAPLDREHFKISRYL